MTGPDDALLDLYATWSHKAALQARHGRTMAPSWVPGTDLRRLAVYKLCAAYLSNSARMFLDTDAETKADRREYGDPSLLVSRIAAAVLGDGATLAVDGAVVPALPAIPDRPEPAPEGADPIEARIAAVTEARWQRDATAAVDEWAAAVDAQPAAAERQAWIDAWAEREAVGPKLARLVDMACGLGDGVAAMAWDADRQRPTVRIYDPGFYFPTDADGGDFSDRVHLAWEFERPDTPGGAATRWVRRLTWELVPIADTYGDDEVTSRDGDSLDAETGTWLRRYPWTPTDGPGSPVACVYTDAEWETTTLAGAAVEDFAPDRAVVTAWREDLGVDFIPLVHLQGVDVGDDFGRSVLAVVGQLLDDLAMADTDVASAAALAAGPAVSLSGTSLPTDAIVAPGAVWKLGADGRMDVLDMTAGLGELRASRRDLEDRLAVNAQVPAEVLGRVAGSDNLSGVAIDLRFGPFRQLVEQALRPLHLPKLALIARFAQRLAQANGALDEGETPVVRVAPGAYLPSDLSGLVTMVAGAREAGIVSEEQSVALLAAGGMSHVDVGGEVARIRAADPERAKLLFEATGNEEAAAAWAGVEPGPPAADPGAGV